MHVLGVVNITVQILRVRDEKQFVMYNPQVYISINIHPIFSDTTVKYTPDTSHKCIRRTLEEHVFSSKINAHKPVTVHLVPEVNLYAW